MLIRTFEHEPFEGPANIEKWAAARGHQMMRTRVFDGDAFPDNPDFDLLVVMGGPMSVHDEFEFPWMSAEKLCLKQAVARGRSVLGVCLGAQLLSEALGGQVGANPHREIGWHPVRLMPGAGAGPAFAGLPATFTAFHWHGETFSVPRGASLLAQSEACVNQAFAVGGKLVGVQFHFETSAESLEEMLLHGADELTESAYVQTAAQIRAGAAEHLAALEPMLFRMLDNMAREI